MKFADFVEGEMSMALVVEKKGRRKCSFLQVTELPRVATAMTLETEVIDRALGTYRMQNGGAKPE